MKGLAIRLVVVAALVAQAWWAIRLTEYDQALEDGKEAFDAGSFPASLEHFERARRLWDRDAEVWSWVGYAAASAYRRPPKEGWSEAEGEAFLRRAWVGYAGAVLRRPMDSWSWSGLAQLALYRARQRDKEGVDLGDLERRGEGLLDATHAAAVAAAKLAIRLQPSGYQELDVLARIYESTGEIEKARAAYVESARMLPAPSFHRWGSGRRLFRGLYDAILQGLKEGVDRAPPFEKSMLNLEVGRFARSQSDLDTALEHFRAAKAASREPFWSFYAGSELASLLEELGRLPEAIEELRTVPQLGEARSAVSRRLGSLEARAGKFEDACRDLRDALREVGLSTELRLETAEACRQAKEYDTAEQVLKDGLGVPSENLPLARALLDLYREMGRSRAANTLLWSWQREYPDRQEFRQWAAEIGGVGPVLPDDGGGERGRR